MVGRREQILFEACRASNIDILYAFGSRAREVQELVSGARESLPPSISDVDIGIVPAAGMRLSAREKAGIASALEELFGATRVDLVVLSEADPFLAANVIRGERLFCADGYKADELELYVLRMAGDLAPFERERLALIAKQ